MKNNGFASRFSTVLLLCVLCLTAGCSAAHVGPYPDAALIDGAGHSHTLAEHRGKYLLLAFWAPWCTQCVHEMAALSKLQNDLANEHFSVLGISVSDDLTAVNSVLSQARTTYPSLIDVAGQMQELFHVESIPAAVLLDPNGRIVMLDDPNDGMKRKVLSGVRDWLRPEYRTLITENIR